MLIFTLNLFFKKLINFDRFPENSRFGTFSAPFVAFDFAQLPAVQAHNHASNRQRDSHHEIIVHAVERTSQTKNPADGSTSVFEIPCRIVPR